MRGTAKIGLLCMGMTLALWGKAAATGPADPDSLPTVDEVLEKYVQAIGGKSTIEKMNTLVIKGAVDVPSTGETGTIEIYRKAPNKEMEMISTPSNGPSQRGFDGTVGWNWDPDSGPTDMSPFDLVAMKLESDFYRDIRLKELYPKMSVRSKEKAGEREAYVIEAPRSDGTSERMYFDVQTGLLVRSDVPLDVPDEGRTVVNSQYEDYREVDGVKIPFTIRQASAYFDYVIKLREAKHNVPIDDAKFKKPSE